MLRSFSGNFTFFFVLIFVLCLYQESVSQNSIPDNFIRHNGVGYLVSDIKIAIVGAQSNLKGQAFYLIEENKPEKVAYTGIVQADRGNKNTPFKHNHPLDFSDFKIKGRYILKLKDGTVSAPFAIGGFKEYQDALALVLEFFRAQRCGDIDPILHKPCHLNDKNAKLDVSGGWHDAGDYIKFMITNTFTAVEMLTAADYAASFNFEKAMADAIPQNNIPDLLDEARIGLEWILKMTSDYANGNYYFQVSGEEDHSGWRLPETDDADRDAGKSRSLHKGWGGNLLGRSSAALAIAARLFDKYDAKFAAECLTRAEALFAEKDKFENVQKSNPAEYYNERSWLDDMVLGSAELYQTTKKLEYHNYAKTNLSTLRGDDIGWNGTDFLAYAACFKANIEPNYCKSKMIEALTVIEENANKNSYFLSSRYVWGTTALFTGDAQKAIMYYYLTADPVYLDLATSQRDYLLGRNNWGTSFVIGLGPVYPKNAHSQLNNLAGLHRGAVVGGPAEKSSWKRVFPTLKIKDDKFKKFQSEIIYYDFQPDYYTNEVALDYTVPSIFIMLHNVAKSMKQ